MSTITSTIDTKLLQDLLNELKTYKPRLVKNLRQSAQAATERYGDRLIQLKLRPYPPPRDKSKKFRASYNTEKNKKAVAWIAIHYPNGYKRTGAMGRAWRLVLVPLNGGGVDIQVINDRDGASYVYGSELHDWERVPSHADTGWVSFGDVGQDVVLDIGTQYETLIIAGADDILTKVITEL